jgi:hypothetical protein
MSAAVGAARRAKQWAVAAAHEADRLIEEARKEAASEDRRRRLKQILVKTGRVLRSAGRAALIAAVATGIAAAQAERSRGKLKSGRG